MRCHFCDRPLHSLDPRRPWRLLVPRRRACRRVTLGWPYKALFSLLLALALLCLLILLA